MAKITKQLPANEVRELVWDSVHDEYTGRSRWGIYIDSVIKDDDGYWLVSWEDGATESQDYDSFESWGEKPEMITLTKVEKKSIVVDKWVEIDV